MFKLISVGLIQSVILMSFSFSAALADEDHAPVSVYQEAVGQLVKDMDEEQQQGFHVLISSYTTLNAVRSVRTSVEAGIRSCGENNPEAKAGFDEKFVSWDQALGVAVHNAEKVVENTVKVQRFAPVIDLKEVLSLFDKAMSYQEGKARALETPVTDIAGCNKLIDTMDDTQARLIDLMHDSFGAKKSAKEDKATD